MYINSDQDYIDMHNKIETQKFKVKYLEEIIKQFKTFTFEELGGRGKDILISSTNNLRIDRCELDYKLYLNSKG